MKIAKKTRNDWDKISSKKDNEAIAKKIGVHPKTIFRARKGEECTIETFMGIHQFYVARQSEIESATIKKPD